MGSARHVTLTFWHWLGLGGLLLLLEILTTPGFVFMWLAIAAALTGAALWLVPQLIWQLQLLLFAAAALASVGAWFAWRRSRAPTGPGSGLNNRALALVGTEAVLVQAIGPGNGRIRVGDSTWLASGPDLPAGIRVQIVGARGAVLLVEPVEAHPPPD